MACRAIIALLTSFIVLNSVFRIRIASADESSDILCRTASTSCGRCLSVHKDCVWCVDQSFQDEFRCGTSETLRETCRTTSLVSQPENEIQIGPSLDFGTLNPQSRTPSQIQPNEVRLTIRPGVGLSFGLRYRHADSATDEVYLLNSDVGQGAKIDVTSNCSESQRTDNDPRSCEKVKVGDILAYNITLTLLDCELSQGDFSVSMGLSGVREIMGVFVTPVCGCECEKIDKQELRSETCHRAGNLICGKCFCQPRKSGKTCEFDGAATTTKAPMDHQCRTNNSQPDCSGRGSCIFGRCVCNHLTSYRYYGRYCECDDASCPRGPNDLLCSGNGQCQCKTCHCNPGWSANDCHCSESSDQCISSNGGICNDVGYCQCNKCYCYQANENLALSPTCETIPLTTTTREPEPETYPQPPHPLPDTHMGTKPRTSQPEPRNEHTDMDPFRNRPIERETARSTNATTTHPIHTRLIATKTETVQSERATDGSPTDSQDQDHPFVPPILRAVDGSEPSQPVPEPRPQVDEKHHHHDKSMDGDEQMVGPTSGGHADGDQASHGAALSKQGQGGGQVAPVGQKAAVEKKGAAGAASNCGPGAWLVVLLAAPTLKILIEIF